MDGLTVNSGTTNTVAEFISTDSGAGIKLTDNVGSSSVQTTDELLRIGVDEDAAVASSAIAFRVDGSEKVRIDTSGNVGIGETSPDDKLHIKTASGDAALRFENSAGNNSRLILDSSNNTKIEFNSTPRIVIDSNGNVGIGKTPNRSRKLEVAGTMNLDDGSEYEWGDGSISIAGNSSTDVMTFATAGAERMRITSGGSVLIGTSTTPTYPHKLVCSGSAIPDGTVSFVDTDVSVGLANAVMSLGFTGDTDATSGYFIYMTDGNGAIGSIQAASGTSVSFNTTSDERLKRNIVDASPQLDIIKSIRVREFDWTRNDHHELGLIAQELVEIVPNVVTVGGEDETKNPYGVDYGKLTPYLIKALQEQQEIIDDLKSRIETLEE